MKQKNQILAGACIAALAFCGALSAQAQSPSPKAKASASPAKSMAPASSPASAKPARSIPFRGTASAIDQSAKTFTIAGKTSSRVFKITDESKVTKAGSAATLADLADGDKVTGSYWKKEDGSFEVRSLKIGGKTEAEKAADSKKKSKKTDKSEDDEAAATPDE